MQKKYFAGTGKKLTTLIQGFSASHTDKTSKL
jgi:hypothetical protein